MLSSLPCLILVFWLFSSALAIPSKTTWRRSSESKDPAGSRTSDNPPATICGDIIDAVNSGVFVFNASEAYDCLRSVPFNDAVALRFIDYYNTTIQFHSTVSLLRDPPDSYQQPAFDIMQGLASLRDNVTANVYKNQYAFEADLQYLVYQIHDTHVDLSAGILAAFTFGSQRSILSASVDGKTQPKIWFQDDISNFASNPGSPIPSPIVLINDEDVLQYLTRFAAFNSYGTVEPHADWNLLMGSPVLDIQFSDSIFDGGATFYPGDELKFTLANGSEISDRWLAFYNEPYFTGPLTTGGDFYNYFVLGLLPASYDNVTWPDVFNSSAIWEDEFELAPSITNWSTITSAYPDNPIVTQEGLSSSSGAMLTGYLLPDISAGVLSLPTFAEFDLDVESFAVAVDQFIQNCTSRGMQKIIIDLQQNSGGNVLLALTTFRQFFPEVTPFAASHRRSHELGDILGNTLTEQFQSLIDNGEMETALQLEGNEWVVTPRLNAKTGRNFTSWKEYAGPVLYGGDYFSLMERYDLANAQFDESIFDGWYPTDYVDQVSTPTPYNASNIIILTNGLCASTCSLFGEMMTQAGVRSVVVGGRPEPGPMQAWSGTRGAIQYTAAQLDQDFQNASLAVPSDNYEFVDALTPLVSARDPGIWINQADFTLRDQLRSLDDHEPLQLKFQAADCRLYWTIENVFNFTRLWSDAAAAVWDDPGLCVDGSTGFTTSPASNDLAKTPPPRLFSTSPPLPATPGIDFDASTGGLRDGSGNRRLKATSSKTQECDKEKENDCGDENVFFCFNMDPNEHQKGYCVSWCNYRAYTNGCPVADQSCSLHRIREEPYSPRLCYPVHPSGLTNHLHLP